LLDEIVRTAALPWIFIRPTLPCIGIAPSTIRRHERPAFLSHECAYFGYMVLEYRK